MPSSWQPPAWAQYAGLRGLHRAISKDSFVLLHQTSRSIGFAQGCPAQASFPDAGCPTWLASTMSRQPSQAASERLTS